MRFTFYDVELNRIADIFNCLSCLWHPQYNDMGECAIEFEYSPRIIALTEKALYVTLDIDKTHTPMILVGRETNDGKTTFRGNSCLWILTQRASGFIDGHQMPYGKPGTHIQSVVRSITPWGKSGKGGLIVGSSVPDGAARIRALQGSLAFDQVVNIAQEHDIGIKFRIENQQLIMDLYKPALSPDIFSEKFGNIYGTRVVYSEMNAHTVVVVKAEDKTRAIKIVVVGDNSIRGAARREHALTDRPQGDGETDEEFTARLQKAGWGAMANSKPVKDITFSTSSSLDLGQLIKVDLPSAGITTEIRCTGIIINSSNNDISTKYTVGNGAIRI